ncbi:hypothetical protein EGX47_16945 [Yersinia pseudotuberculosis]|uniref:Uncharacterized protein n=1 Tax=Yersinia pseudotuberculosis TaxID=633 RepID=A0ABM7AJT6_YERPU|nr:hypothetical protein [Yersinia pseudotuberculosis]AYW92818.1 hypothetical protein EGX47_16945 [Yersinia pseudotuberculosis]
MKELNSFTVERLEELAVLDESLLIFPASHEQVAALARIALAAKRDHHIVELTEKVNSPELPEGWKLVPIEPTRQMMSQGHFAMGGTDRGKFMRIYQAMLAAAPEKENG